jgi:hypothetical protein
LVWPRSPGNQGTKRGHHARVIVHEGEFIEKIQRYFETYFLLSTLLGGSLVTTARRVLRFRMEKEASRYEE